MAELPFFLYALTDELTLTDYAQGNGLHSPSVGTMKLRSRRKARSFEPYLPDYVYQNRFNHEEQDIHSEKVKDFSSYLVKGLTYLAKKYLHVVNDTLYVRKECHEEWMEVVQLCPPLIICAAFYLDAFKHTNNRRIFINQTLVKQFSETAQRRPYLFDLENMVHADSKLSDLHIHLNGSTETDMLWWSQIGNVEEWIASFRQQYYSDSKVFQQYEQEVGFLNYFCNNLRTGKRLIDEIASLFVDKDEVFTETWQFLFSDREYPTLVKGAYFYLLVLKELEETNECLAHKFHHLLLTESSLHRMVVQQKTQKGFIQFQMIPNNDIRWLYEDKSYESRFKQLFMGSGFNFMEYLEGRFAPQKTKEANLVLVKRIKDGMDKLHEIFKQESKSSPKMGLVAHFIKLPDNHYLDGERHHKLRREIADKSIALISAQRYLDYDDPSISILGIDAAANEMDAGPEVFAPSFRWLRTEWTQVFKHDLKQTFHAGEDFVHLLSGLRMMYEAVEFLDMKQGDRIGHGTAAGIDPELWMERVGETIYIRQGEWLDNLIIVCHLISEPSSPYENLRGKMPAIMHEINRLTITIYGRIYSMNDLLRAWKFRKYDPAYYLFHTQTYQRDTLDVRVSVLKEMAAYPRARQLFRLYHYSQAAKTHYNQYISISLRDNIFNAEELRQIQNLVLNSLAKKNIALEVPITSNLCISFYRNLNEHHIGRWIKGRSEHNLLIPAIVMGTDDPGIFMTNIYIEYARLMTYLENKGYNINERIEKVLQINRISNYYRFLDTGYRNGANIFKS